MTNATLLIPAAMHPTHYRTRRRVYRRAQYAVPRQIGACRYRRGIIRAVGRRLTRRLIGCSCRITGDVQMRSNARYIAIRAKARVRSSRNLRQ